MASGERLSRRNLSDERVEQALRPAVRLQEEAALAAEVVLKNGGVSTSRGNYLRG
jgi:hypothetical protein